MVNVLRARMRRMAARACILVTATVGLGLTTGPVAQASCAGPQLGLQQNGSSIGPRRVGDGPDEQLLYEVDRAQPVQVAGTNLTFDCNDTLGTSGGCGAPAPSANPPQPLQDAELRLNQGGDMFNPRALGRWLGPQQSGRGYAAGAATSWPRPPDHP